MGGELICSNQMTEIICKGQEKDHKGLYLQLTTIYQLYSQYINTSPCAVSTSFVVVVVVVVVVDVVVVCLFLSLSI